MSIFEEAISEYVWDHKYRYRLHQTLIDQTIEDTWARVANATASVEIKAHQKNWQQQFYDILEDFQFLPGGRILSGAGTQQKVTLFNCFVMPILEDSIPGIFDALKEGALTLQQGGGVGYDFSMLRPRGFSIQQAGATASGPVSFMHIWDAMCGTMLTSGARRGAMMAVLRCDHPDIEEFITAKSSANALRHFNLSVLVTNRFMQAVENDSDWDLVFPYHHQSDVKEQSLSQCDIAQATESQVVRRVKARTLWLKIIKAAYDYAEPGVLFEDTINLQNNLWYREWIVATNPCGEIPLPAYGACNLGALNLTQFVLNPFEEHAKIDWEKLEKTTMIATRFLDNIIDVSDYPLKAQQNESLATRRIGLGITGLGDLFVMLNIRYGSEVSLQLARQIMKIVSETTWQTSIELANERGSFPLFQANKYLAGNFVKSLSSDIQSQIKKNGMRNSHHNTIAPTGTISLLANNISNGLEPIFMPFYERVVRTADGDEKKFLVRDYAISAWKKHNKEIDYPPAWTDTHKLTAEDHLNIQAAVQPYIDNAISKTINLPRDYPFEKLHNVYKQAYELGLKGCTIYRPNSIRGSVLNIVDKEDDVDRCCQVI